MRLFIILIVLLSFKTLSAQDISKQKWKHRVLLIFTSEENAEDYKIQLSFLKNSEEGFKAVVNKVFCSLTSAKL